MAPPAHNVVDSTHSPFTCSVCCQGEEENNPLVMCEAGRHYLHLPCDEFFDKVPAAVLDSFFWSWRCRACYNRSAATDTPPTSTANVPCAESVPVSRSYLDDRLSDLASSLMCKLEALEQRISSCPSPPLNFQHGGSTESTASSDNRSAQAPPVRRNGTPSLSGSGSDVTASSPAPTVTSPEEVPVPRPLVALANLKSSFANVLKSGLKSLQDNSSKASKSPPKFRPRKSASYRTSATSTSKPTFGTADPIHSALKPSASTRSQMHRNSVFVTRLAADTSPEDVKRHIVNSAGIEALVSKLRTRFSTYASFRISAPNPKDLFNPGLWPEGTLVLWSRGNSHTEHIAPEH